MVVDDAQRLLEYYVAKTTCRTVGCCVALVLFVLRTVLMFVLMFVLMVAADLLSCARMFEFKTAFNCVDHYKFRS